MAREALAALRPSAAAAGRTSGRPCSCEERRATWVQTNPRNGVFSMRTDGLLGVAGALEPALMASEGRMPKRSQHGVSGGQDGRSERPGDRVRQSRALTQEAA
jgi:hypothetical protein